MSCCKLGGITTVLVDYDAVRCVEVLTELVEGAQGMR